MRKATDIDTQVVLGFCKNIPFRHLCAAGSFTQQHTHYANIFTADSKTTDLCMRWSLPSLVLTSKTKTPHLCRAYSQLALFEVLRANAFVCPMIEW